MAIRASDRVTLAVLPALTYARTYYCLQASTLGEPAKPTTNPPPDAIWKPTEPPYTAGATVTLYTVQLSVYGTAGFEYGDVQKSSSFEAAKQAYNLALASRNLSEGLYQTIPSVTAPTTSPTGALKNGDQWWKIGSGATAGKFIGVAVWNGSSWQDRQLVADSVMVPGSVGAVLIEDGAMTAKLVEGDSIRTAASGQRVQLDTAGLRTFNASNVETSKLAADAGGLALVGSLVTTEGGNTRRATLSDGGLFLDIPGSPGAGMTTVDPLGISKIGDGALYIEKKSGPGGIAISEYGSAPAGISISSHLGSVRVYSKGRPSDTPIVAKYVATASIPALSSSPNVGTPVLSTGGYESAFSTELFTPGAHSLTVSEAGVYEFKMRAAVPAVGTGRSFVQLTGPGHTDVTEFGPGTYNLTGTWMSQLAAGDTVTFCAYQSTGAARTAPTYIDAIYYGPRT